METLFQYAPIVVFIFWLISLVFTKVPYEKHTLKDSHKLLLHFGRIIFITFFVTLSLVQISELFAEDTWGDYTLDEIINMVLPIAILIFFLITGMYIATLGLLSAIKTKSFYIYKEVYSEKEQKKQKLYIIKSIDNNKILLSNDKTIVDTSIQIITSRDYLDEKEIYTETTPLKQAIKELITF